MMKVDDIFKKLNEKTAEIQAEIDMQGKKYDDLLVKREKIDRFRKWILKHNSFVNKFIQYVEEIGM